MEQRFWGMSALALMALGAGFGGKQGPEQKKPVMTPQQRAEYRQAVVRTAGMVNDPQAQRLVHGQNLNLMNLTWEDTGRYKGSAVGPNISDMTIQVGVSGGPRQPLELFCMPVIRHPNFSDTTADVDPMAFTLLVGNHQGRELKRVSLFEFLRDPTPYLSKPFSWTAKTKTLLAPRDYRVLASAQACFLPVPKQGIATFNPVLFNYQSSKKNPAVLTILATREGTSVTIIDNVRDAFETGALWGQRLFHNDKGMRASLTGQRESDFQGGNVRPDDTIGPGRPVDSGLNMVLLIQVPLKYKESRGFGIGGGMAPGVLYNKTATVVEESNVENAVIGHGDIEGPFTEMDNLPVERDSRFPVRVTVQFYKATSNGVVNEADVAAIRRDIDRVYAKGDAVGSLVTSGETGRITEYEGSKVQPPNWWEEFWKRYETNTGISRQEARRRLMELLGRDYSKRPVTDLYLRDLLRK